MGYTFKYAVHRCFFQIVYNIRILRNFQNVSWKPSPTTPVHPQKKHHLPRKKHAPSMFNTYIIVIPFFSSKSRIFPWSHIFFQLQSFFLCFLQPSHGIFQLFLHRQFRTFGPWQVHLGPSEAADGQIQCLVARRRNVRRNGWNTRLGDRDWRAGGDRIHCSSLRSENRSFWRKGGNVIWNI